MRIISNDGLIDMPYESTSFFAIKDDIFDYSNDDEAPYTIMDSSGIVLKHVPCKAAAQYILRDMRRRFFDAVNNPKKNEKMYVVNLDDYDNVIVSEKYKEVIKL